MDTFYIRTNFESKGDLAELCIWGSHSYNNYSVSGREFLMIFAVWDH